MKWLFNLLKPQIEEYFEKTFYELDKTKKSIETIRSEFEGKYSWHKWFTETRRDHVIKALRPGLRNNIKQDIIDDKEFIKKLVEDINSLQLKK